MRRWFGSQCRSKVLANICEAWCLGPRLVLIHVVAVLDSTNAVYGRWFGCYKMSVMADLACCQKCQQSEKTWWSKRSIGQAEV